MEESGTTRRRTVLKTIGTGVVGGTVLTGRVAADLNSGRILMERLSFNPSTYHTGPGTVTWEHADETFEGPSTPCIFMNTGTRGTGS